MQLFGDFCRQCNQSTDRAVLKALTKTFLSLLPELVALSLIITVLPASGHSNYWLIIPVVLLALPRGWYVLNSTFLTTVDHYISQSGIAHVWEAQLVVKDSQAAWADVGAAIRREARALAIPLTTELEEALNGQRHPQDLSDRDYQTIRPAVAAAMKRERDRQAAYGIDAGLPRGDHPAC